MNISKKKKGEDRFHDYLDTTIPQSTPSLLYKFVWLIIISKNHNAILGGQSLLTVNIFAQHCVRCQLACCAHVATQWGK